MSNTLKSFEPLLLAIDSFIRGNSNFESSIVLNTAIEELEQCESLQQCFALPIQHKLFNIDTALKWVLFLNIVPEKIVEQNAEDEEFTPLVEEFNLFSEFSCSDAMKLIASIYDIGIQDIVLSHLEDESDEESDEDSDGDSDEDEDEDEESSSINEKIVTKNK
uniref:Uncharacterized protein n=1 Tax=viral metagenome TaxID=1070528 RepID=A0A6C0I2H8_9ZZZZ